MTSSGNVPRPTTLVRKGGFDPTLQVALADADSRAGSMSSPAPKVKDTEVDVIKTALHNPPQKPDLPATVIGVGGSVSAIVAVVKEMAKEKAVINLFDVGLVAIGSILLALQLAVYFSRKRDVTKDEPFHNLAKQYIDVLMQEIAEYRRSSSQRTPPT